MTLGILGKLESRVSFRDRYILNANQEARDAKMEQIESNESIQQADSRTRLRSWRRTSLSSFGKWCFDCVLQD